MSLNPRQKTGIGMLITGIASLVAGFFVTGQGSTPDWLRTGLDILAAVAPMFGLVVNMPSNTDPGDK